MDQTGHTQSASHSPQNQKDVRCNQCSKLLAKHEASSNNLEIKCVRCGSLNPINAQPARIVVTDSSGKELHSQSVGAVSRGPVHDENGNLICYISVETTS
jgi:phage FluMu protein Com